MTNTTNGFDDFDTKVTAEEFYDGWTEDEGEDEAARRDALRLLREAPSHQGFLERLLQQAVCVEGWGAVGE